MAYQPGDIICQSEPFAVAVTIEHLRKVCSWCLRGKAGLITNSVCFCLSDLSEKYLQMPKAQINAYFNGGRWDTKGWVKKSGLAYELITPVVGQLE